MAFQVSSKIDSRTILDQMGAEALLGQGDMLYMPPGTGLPARVHGAFVHDDEVHRVVESLNERSEEQPSELQSPMRTSYAVFCLKKKNQDQNTKPTYTPI